MWRRERLESNIASTYASRTSCIFGRNSLRQEAGSAARTCSRDLRSRCQIAEEAVVDHLRTPLGSGARHLEETRGTLAGAKGPGDGRHRLEVRAAAGSEALGGVRVPNRDLASK